MAEFVLRLHCPHHIDDFLIDIEITEGENPLVTWRSPRRGRARLEALRESGLPSMLNVGFLREAPQLRGPLTEEEIHPMQDPGSWPWPPGALRGETGEWDGESLAGATSLSECEQVEFGVYRLPQGKLWDSNGGRVLDLDSPERGEYFDDKSEHYHLLYTLACPRPSCGYSSKVERPKLLNLIDWLPQGMPSLAQLVDVLPGWRLGVHDTVKDYGATERRPSRVEVINGVEYQFRDWVPTTMLTADLDTLLRVFHVQA